MAGAAWAWAARGTGRQIVARSVAVAKARGSEGRLSMRFLLDDEAARRAGVFAEGCLSFDDRNGPEVRIKPAGDGRPSAAPLEIGSRISPCFPANQESGEGRRTLGSRTARGARAEPRGYSMR